MEKLTHQNSFENGLWEDAYCRPFILTPGHTLQKPSKESGIFQSLGIVSFFFSYKAESKGRAMARCPLNTLLNILKNWSEI